MPLEHLDAGLLLKEVARQYHVVADEAEFVPMGEDSWAYRVGRLWVSVRRDLRGQVPAAYRLAYNLHQSGLDFVLAPLPGADGIVVRNVGGFPVVVFPFLHASPLTHFTLRRDELGNIVDMIAAVHGCNSADDIPTEDFLLSFDDDLTAACDLTTSLEAGPFSHRLNSLLIANRDQIAMDRREISELSAYCAANMGRGVITHGEPSAQNILVHNGRFLLADWGAAAWGPPERDWFHVRRTLNADPPCRPEFLRFYELRWRLSEIAEYSTILRSPHRGNAEDEAMWSRLLRYLPE